jgi:hypothetical protein
MSKRSASHQLTKDEFEAGSEEQVAEDGTWKPASEEKLAARTFVKVKRKGPTPSVSSGVMPTFNFGTPVAGTPATPAEAPKAAAPNAFALAAAKNRPNAFGLGNWECQSCLLSNKKDLAKCAACEAPNPAMAPAEENTSEVSTSAPTFGGVPSATGTKFAFGAPASSGTKFTFGSAGGASLTFGGVAGDGVADWAKTTDKKTEGTFTTTATFGVSGGPKEEFKDKKAEASGEETDQLLLKVNSAKVYTLKAVEGKEGDEGGTVKATKFVESGAGELRLNKYTVGGTLKCRCVLRAEKTQRLVLNAPLVKGMGKELQGEKFVRFTSVDLEGQMAVFLLKFKAKSDAQAVFNQMETCVSSIIKETPKK